jgi:5-methylcytosine-specific restriction endonuclease McrA
MEQAFTKRKGSGASRPSLNKAAWQRVRKAVRARDGNACRNCGATSGEAKLSVHHLVPASLGGTDDMANLLTLCSTCHPLFERIARQTQQADARSTLRNGRPRFIGPDGQPWSRHWFDY